MVCTVLDLLKGNGAMACTVLVPVFLKRTLQGIYSQIGACKIELFQALFKEFPISSREVDP